MVGTMMPAIPAASDVLAPRMLMVENAEDGTPRSLKPRLVHPAPIQNPQTAAGIARMSRLSAVRRLRRACRLESATVGVSMTDTFGQYRPWLFALAYRML